jgi:hypothetical protein
LKEKERNFLQATEEEKMPIPTISLIRRFVALLPQGKLFTTREVLAFGSRSAVDSALFRLVKALVIRRLARGVFIRNDFPQHHPAPAEVARVKAQSFGRRIVTHGILASWELGLTPVGQDAHIYAVDGRSSAFRYGDLTIKFQGLCPRKVMVGDSQAGMAIRALWHLGRTVCDKSTAARVTASFKRTDRDELRQHAGFMPGWMLDSFSWPARWQPDQDDWRKRKPACTCTGTPT